MEKSDLSFGKCLFKTIPSSCGIFNLLLAQNHAEINDLFYDYKLNNSLFYIMEYMGNELHYKSISAMLSYKVSL